LGTSKILLFLWLVLFVGGCFESQLDKQENAEIKNLLNTVDLQSSQLREKADELEKTGIDFGQCGDLNKMDRLFQDYNRLEGEFVANFNNAMNKRMEVSEANPALAYEMDRGLAKAKDSLVSIQAKAIKFYVKLYMCQGE
jgi:hypothetical protein